MKKILQALFVTLFLFCGTHVFSILTDDETDDEFDMLTTDETALFEAVKKNDLNAVKDLIENKKVNIKAEETALLYDFYHNHKDIVTYFVDHGLTTNLDTYFTDYFENEEEPYHKGYAYEEIYKFIDLDTVKYLLFNNAEFNKNDEYGAYQRILDDGDDDLKKLIPLFDEIIEYKKNVKSMSPQNALEKAITHNGKNDSNFTKEQWLTHAILNNHAVQIQYALDQKIFTPMELLEFLASNKRMPLILLNQLLEKTDEQERIKIMKIAKENDNKKIGKELSDYTLKLNKLVGKTKEKTAVTVESIQNIIGFEKN